MSSGEYLQSNVLLFYQNKPDAYKMPHTFVTVEYAAK